MLSSSRVVGDVEEYQLKCREKHEEKHMSWTIWDVPGHQPLWTTFNLPDSLKILLCHPHYWYSLLPETMWITASPAASEHCHYSWVFFRMSALKKILFHISLLLFQFSASCNNKHCQPECGFSFMHPNG